MISDSDKETQDASEDVQDTSLLRTSLYYGHLSITDTFVLRTPLYYGDLSISDTSPFRTVLLVSAEYPWNYVTTLYNFF